MSYVFLHGLGQNAQAWDKVQSHFPGAICPDLAQCPDYPSLYQTLTRSEERRVGKECM